MKLCIIGHPVSHSLSPAIYGRFFERMGIDATYEAVDILPDEFSEEITSVAEHFDGFNVTIPFKEKIIAHVVSQVEPPLSAINCVFERRGYNTDWVGFGKPLLERSIEEPVMIIGAGGAARAVIFFLRKAGVKRIELLNRTLSRAEKIKEEFEILGRFEISVFPFESIREVASRSMSIVNASSLGMNGEETGITSKELAGKSLVYDLIYWKTPLIELSHNCGVETVLDGRDMLLHQALENLKIWGLPSGDVFEKTFWEVVR
ncbi:shikimate dehydrogenase [Mesotoga sp.]|uniref:shikimate dehydrogenase family protein n=1 Tax=Mesotoga sp. TaxID=2053577 RepID=UPI002B74AD2C|nr:shikimate dehydrogenase [Mesotoga sp.]HRX66309.1 shikimate dehydrogenase [Mesotoga sp.]